MLQTCNYNLKPNGFITVTATMNNTRQMLISKETSQGIIKPFYEIKLTKGRIIFLQLTFQNNYKWFGD